MENEIIKLNDLQSIDSAFDGIVSVYSQLSNQIKSNQISFIEINTKKQINPLFFMLLESINTIYRYTIVVDISSLIRNKKGKEYTYQHQAIHMIQHFIDIGTFVKISNKRNASDRHNIAKINILYRILNDDGNSIGTSRIKFTKNKNYDTIPIIKIKGNSHDVNLTDDTMEIKRNLYDPVSNYHNNKHEDQKKTINNMLQVLIGTEFKNDDFARNISIIIFELLDNINKHTLDQKDLNAYISIQKLDGYLDILIYDNYKKGFLKKYNETLNQELKDYIPSQRKDNSDDFIKEFIDSAKKTANIENDKSTIEDLFNIEKITFNHQIPRFIHHFGIPMLIKVIKEINGSFDIFLHRGDENETLVNYKFSSQLNSTMPTENKRRGTFINIRVPLENIPNKKDYETSNDNKKNISYGVGGNQLESLFKYKKNNRFKYQIINDMCKDTDNNAIPVLLYKEGSFGKIIRDIYYYKFKFNHSDFILIGLDIKSFSLYLEILSDYIFYNKKKEKLYDISSNILFYDEDKLMAVFMGGKSYSEFNYANKTLINQYAINKNEINFFKKINTSGLNKSETLDSQIILNNKFIPIELFIKNDKNYLYLTMLNNWLNKKESDMNISKLDKLFLNDMHINVGQGIHLKKFHQIKRVFENSTWVSRIAFDISCKIYKIYQKKGRINHVENIMLIGYSIHSSSVLSIIKTLLNISSSPKIILNMVEEEREINEIIYDSQITDIIIFSPISTSLYNIKRLYAELNKNILKLKSIKWSSSPKNIVNYNYYWNKYIKNFRYISIFCGFKLSANIQDKCDTNFYAILEKSLLEGEDYYYSNDCNLCFRKSNDYANEIPLIEMDKDGYTPKTYYNSPKKTYRNKGKYSLSIEELNWYNSIEFGHIVRGHNHFQYYIKMIPFLKNNINACRNFLQEKIKLEISEFEYDNIIIVTPTHTTNNDFITLVNQDLFDDLAIIHYYDTSIESSAYNTNSIKLNAKDRIYFVDDTISSGNTLHHFYSLINTVYEFEGSSEKNIKFHGIITLLNRTTEQDFRTFENYVEHQNFFAFTNLNIKPIKTYMEQCFLCMKEKEHDKLSKYTSLNFLQNIIKRKKEKIICSESNIFETKESTDNLRSFLKMYSLHYVNNSLNSEGNSFIDKKDTSTLDKASFNSILEDFYKSISKYYMLDNMDNKIHLIASNILMLESKIALIKTFSFPPLVHYLNIRINLTRWLIQELDNLIKTNTLPSSLTFNVDDIEDLLLYIENSKPSLLDPKNEKYKGLKELIILHYKKSGILGKDIAKYRYINYINFLLVTAGHLNINYILSPEVLSFYKKTILKHDDKSVYPQYIFALKTLVSNSIYKANKLNEYLKPMLQSRDYHKASYMLDGMWIENNYSEYKFLVGKKYENIGLDPLYSLYLKKIFQKINNLDNFKNNELKLAFKEMVSALCKDDDIDIEFWINFNTKKDIPIELINLFNLDQEHNKDEDSMIHKMFYGLHSDKLGKLNDTSGHTSDIWSNILLYKNETDRPINLKDISSTLNHAINNYFKSPNLKKYTTVSLYRITSNHKPVAVMAINHSKAIRHNFEYLELSKHILLFSNSIAKIVDTVMTNDVFRDDVIKSKQIREILKAVDGINHSIQKYYQITTYFTDLQNLIQKIDIDKKKLSEEINFKIHSLENYSEILVHHAKIGGLRIDLPENYNSSQALGVLLVTSLFFKKDKKETGFYKTLKTFTKNVQIFSEQLFQKNKKELDGCKFSIIFQSKESSFRFIYDDRSIQIQENIKSIISELIFNAIVNNPKGTDINIISNREVLKIQNTGEVMTSEIFNDIVKNGYKIGTKGMGIGLKSIFVYLNKLGYTIDIDSEYSEGTCLMIYKIVTE